MGLYSKKINYKALTFFHNSFVSLLIKYLDKLYFLGNEEYKIAINSLEKHDKIVFKPFNIDCEFWKTSKLKIEEAAAKKQARIDSNQDIIVGLNKYQHLQHYDENQHQDLRLLLTVNQIIHAWQINQAYDQKMQYLCL